MNSIITFDDLLEEIKKLDCPIIEKLDNNLYKIDGVVCNKALLNSITRTICLMYKNRHGRK